MHLHLRQHQWLSGILFVRQIGLTEAEAGEIQSHEIKEFIRIHADTFPRRQSERFSCDVTGCGLLHKPTAIG